MSQAADTPTETQRLDALYRAKAKAEIAEAEALLKSRDAVRGQGDVLAEVLLVKGVPGPADLSAGRALAGDDGVAVGRALDALGLPKARYAVCTRAAKAPVAVRDERLRLMVEAIDPATIVLLDAGATADFARASRVDPPDIGIVGVIGGRHVLAVENFEASLGDEDRKRRVWRQLQALAATGQA